MNFKQIVNPLIPNVVLEYRRRRKALEDIARFKFDSDAGPDIVKNIKEKYGHDSELLHIFANTDGYIVHKWHHYIPLYDRYFSPYKGRKIRFLEIGVSDGGSLQMWRRYFGEDAIIFGIDINSKCQALNGKAAQVRIGSQTDSSFLESVVQEMGGIDIVLDDGSHQMEHIQTTLRCLFPHLSYGGIYMIEDLHTAYWKAHGGGYRARGNFFGFVRSLADDMHHWYHGNTLKQSAVTTNCSGIHMHDSIVVLEKNRVFQPVHSRVGRVRVRFAEASDQALAGEGTSSK